jgi:hypothetical protein
MNDKTDLVAVASIGLFLGFCMLILGTGLSDNWWEQQAIERGYALHCPDTGKFAWKGEC